MLLLVEQLDEFKALVPELRVRLDIKAALQQVYN